MLRASTFTTSVMILTVESSILVAERDKFFVLERVSFVRNSQHMYNESEPQRPHARTPVHYRTISYQDLYVLRRDDMRECC